MKSLMLLWKEVLTEVGTWCGVCTIRDWKTASDRFEHEGLSFVTITLPGFCTELQKALDSGQVSHDQFTGFRRSGGLPRFLGGFLDLVFDRASGSLLDDPSIDAIFALRQLTLMCAKIELECSQERQDAAIDGYIECEKEVKAGDASRSESDYSDFRHAVSILASGMLSRVEKSINEGSTIPKHGPGKTADLLLGNKKYVQTEWPARLEFIFPALDYLFPSWSYYDDLQSVTYLEPGDERPVKVTLVPKTLKTPRIIAQEPTCMMYTQQALMEVIVSEIGRDDILSSLIGFDDQFPNQEMARIGSRSGNLATLDLSEASDRVSNQLVRVLLERFPLLAEGVDSCRSRKAAVPGHGVVRLAKFASMGSALTFPVEALVFTTIVFLGIAKELGEPLSWRIVKRYSKQVRIFGDDIVVPKRFATAVVERLEAFGLRVNHNKSFWTGKFRESCGGDFYDGHDVSIVRVRSTLPTQPRHAEEILSTVSLRNQMYNLGLWKTCQWLDKTLEGVLKHYPTVLPTSPVIGRHSFLGFETQRMCERLHRPLVRGWIVDAPLPSDVLEGSGALVKFFIKRSCEPLDKKHLSRAGRPAAVNLKLRWGSST